MSTQLSLMDKVVERSEAGAVRRWLALLLRNAIVPAAAVAAVTAIASVLVDELAVANISMLYLAAVIASALLGNVVAAVLAALLSFVTYNYFFIDPRFSLTVARADEVLTLVMFVAVALALGALTAQAKEQARVARDEARSAEELFAFSSALSRILVLEPLVEEIVRRISSAAGRSALLLLTGEEGRLAVRARSADVDLPAEVVLKAQYLQAQQIGQTGGARLADGFEGLPLVSGVRRLGMIVLVGEIPPVDTIRTRRYAAMADQAAVAIDRALWARESVAAGLANEGQKLQSALLSSLSHDLRTPLASITGASTTLLQLGDKLDDATRDDLLASIAEEGDRLNRFVGNLFDMTRIESHALKAKREQLDLLEVMGGAVRRAQSAHPELDIDVKLDAGATLVVADPILLEQAVFNVFDNASKYAGTERPVAVRSQLGAGVVTLSITDDGPGIAESDLERIFAKFYRGEAGDGRSAGTGLGLSIVRGFLSAMGGNIRCESPVHGRRGARFNITLPAAKPGAA
jgi:two-component system sensor histidine kinase KdpD